jgi:hypothetical protein
MKRKSKPRPDVPLTQSSERTGIENKWFAFNGPHQAKRRDAVSCSPKCRVWLRRHPEIIAQCKYEMKLLAKNPFDVMERMVGDRRRVRHIN